MCASTVRCPPAPPSLGARPFSSGYAQNRHEILRMLRNHHANPPTHIPATARMCMTCPGLVVSCGYVSSSGLSATDDPQFQPSNWPHRRGLVRYGYREMKRRGSSMRGNERRMSARCGGVFLASESTPHRGTAETKRTLEDEKTAVKTQGAQLWNSSMS